MGDKYIAERRSEHRMIATAPDLIIPPGSKVPVPCITYATLDTATQTANHTRGNGYPLFISRSYVPHCKGGIPGGKGVISGTWNGIYYATEHSDSVRVEGDWAVFHDHKGTGNG